LADFVDLHANTLSGLGCQQAIELLDLFATLTDNDTRFGCINPYQDLVGGSPFNLYFRDSRVSKLFMNCFTYL
jgi:hypothetical protein